MGLRSLIALVSMMSVVALGACSTDAQKVQPETRGKRGESCLARNDCDTGLACLNGICAKNEFNVDVTAKECVRVDCEEDKDCCGSLATSAPAKCKNRELKCNAANQFFPGCQSGGTCTTATEATVCGKSGTCMMGTCSVSGIPSAATCETAADCKVAANTCDLVTETCTATGTFCTSNTQCLPQTATCSIRRCDCLNPAYDPTDPICTDADCEDICLLRCQDRRCLEDASCKTDADCLTGDAHTCDGGRCVQCVDDDGCDADNNETCDVDAGVCHKPCEQNEECPIFEACQKKTGKCEYVGCQEDRDCILAASRGQSNGNGNPGTNAAASSGSDDPRLYKCLPSETNPDIGVCQIPCENDGSCSQFEVCDKGYCKFVGCDSDEQCRAYLGIADEMTSDTKPYIATAKCEAPLADASSSSSK